MYVSVSALAHEFNCTPAWISTLIKRGVLPGGRKEGKVRYLPAIEARLIMRAHEPRRAKAYTSQDTANAPCLTDLI